MIILVEKSLLHFITKMNLFYGGKFLKRSPWMLISCFLERTLGSLHLHFWKLIFSFSDSEKLLYVLKLPAGLLSRENYNFLIFWTCLESKSMYFLKFEHFLKNGFPGQTTMLTRRASEFWVKSRSRFSEISHHDPKTIGKPRSIVSWPECQCFEVIGVIWHLSYYFCRHTLLFLIRRHIFYRHPF